MGSLTNNARKLANFTGFYKGIQSAGAAIAPSIDAHMVPYMHELAANWALLVGGLLVAAPIIFTRVEDTTSLEQDLRFSDETAEEVAPTQDAADEPKPVGATVGAEGLESEKR